ncbi:MAG: hypothetical protein CSA62_12390 [Planctomycetota bacterium]|nr:MAG: hypothetical protein CSA62_12390 [Planctomycetota bacterium]
MSDFDRVFASLASLTNYEKQQPQSSYRFDLCNMERLCAALDKPQCRLGEVTQIAGSKGKGTATHLLAWMGTMAGKRVAAYTSPHVRSVLERVLWRGRPVQEQSFAPHLERVVEAMLPGQTWFEVFTAAALDFFATMEPDWTVLEVGLGGRLDSTTVVPKSLCAITTIELEHTQVLGPDLASIAREKAGILRPGVPCVTMTQGEALAIIEERCQEMEAPLRVGARHFGFDLRARDENGIEAEFWSQGHPSRCLRLPLHAQAQAQAFALARELLLQLDSAAEQELLGQEDHSWLRDALPPGRFHIVDSARPLVIDGAHTNASLACLAGDLEASFPERRFALVFGVASGKRWEQGLGRLLGLVDRAYAAPLVGKTSETSQSVRDLCQSHGVHCEIAPSITSALDCAQAENPGGALLVTGSLYAAGEALTSLGA